MSKNSIMLACMACQAKKKTEANEKIPNFCDKYECKHSKSKKNNEEQLWNADPNCDHNIVAALGGGIKCTKCGGWFCY